MKMLIVLAAAVLLLAMRGFWRLATVPLFKILSETKLTEWSARVEIERRTAWPICAVVREVWVSREHTARRWPFWIRIGDGAQMSDHCDNLLWNLVVAQRLDREHQQPETESA